MTGSVLRLRFPTSADTPTILDFFRAAWGTNHVFARDRPLLEWQFSSARTPFMDTDGISALTIWDGDELVGMQGLIFTEIWCCGAAETGVWLCNLMTLPEYRSKGVGLKLMMAVHALPVRFIATSGINPQLYPLYEKLKYQTIEEIPRLILVLNGEQFSGLIGVLAQSEPQVNKRYLISCRRASFRTIERFGSDWDRAFPIMRGAAYAGIHRTADYMNWRYIDHPRFQYTVTGLFADGELVGVSVTRLEQIKGRSEKVLRLLEFWARSPEATDTVLGGVAEEGRKNDAMFIDFFSTSTLHLNAARERGWREASSIAPNIPSLFQPLDPMPRSISIAVKRLGGQLGCLNDRFLDVFKSDGDQDRPN